MRRPFFGIVADDMTGGLETAAMLVADGVRCAFVTDAASVGDVGEVEAVVVAQKTRVVDPAEAVAKSRAAAEALLAAGVRRLFFKYCATFDSTDRGNIGPVADVLMDLTGARFAIFCPSSPALRRTVYNGHLFLGSQLISESPKRDDPLTPMTDPNLVRVLQRQTRRKVGLLAHPQTSAGGAVLAEVIDRATRDGVRYLVADAIYDGDLANLAAATQDCPLVTGNATIVPHYPPLWRASGHLPSDRHPAALPAVDGKAIVLAGSCAERTREQLAVFEADHPVLRIDLGEVDAAAPVVTEALAWALPLLERGPVLITTSADPEAVSVAQARHGRDGAAELAERILGDIAVAVRTKGVRRFVVAGGETSGAVMERLGVRRLNVGPYGGPGIGTATTCGPDPIAFCLKSGKLGPVGLFAEALNEMTNPGGRE
jgi:uncharacterized protein YgbK (DUF1537 family)